FATLIVPVEVNAQNETNVVPETTPSLEEEGRGVIIETTPGNLTLNFKEADLRTVLQLIGAKSGVNIVAGKEVTGTVTLQLVDVPWEKALKAILKINNYGYEREGNIIMVTTLEKLATRSKSESELSEIQPIITEVFTLKYLDANDAKKALESQLSSRGKISVVQIKGQRGWAFGGESGLAKRERAVTPEVEARSKILVVSDTPPVIERIKEIIKKIDVVPRQVLIEAKILEVNHDRLEDLGIDWGTGTSGAESATPEFIGITRKGVGGKETGSIAGHSLGSEITPSGFGPKASSISGTEPFNTGLELVYKKLTGAQFEVILHALTEKVGANTLSSPRIMTLDNQEATILVGTKYPILRANVSGTDSTTTTTTLDYYQDIGIQLNVVPQINADNYINMIIHPAVTSYTTTLQAKGSAGQTIAEYPIITTREAETQILMRSGETVVIGGLLKDVQIESRTGVPLLSSIPLLGLLFQRKTTDIEKIDLLIFIRAFIIETPVLNEAEEKAAEKIGSTEEFKEVEKELQKKQGKGLLQRWRRLFRD
ncbi:MAG: secretin and TonB N-terminal domain-containing protein, partial [Candidatus Omnitrophica bacterium]|nr:secretin and TonB N-terminal domain-containing protein [Candidatus Omnitrophota bacterium]